MLTFPGSYNGGNTCALIWDRELRDRLASSPRRCDKTLIGYASTPSFQNRLIDGKRAAEPEIDVATRRPRLPPHNSALTGGNPMRQKLLS